MEDNGVREGYLPTIFVRESYHVVAACRNGIAPPVVLPLSVGLYVVAVLVVITSRTLYKVA